MKQHASGVDDLLEQTSAFIFYSAAGPALGRFGLACFDRLGDCGPGDFNEDRCRQA
jgi:hypothetical protein